MVTFYFFNEMYRNEQFCFNYGWEHFWCDPKNFKNFAIREFIKGPFKKPKFVYPVPYVTFSQQASSSIRLSQGIPDCWAEYLVCSLGVLHQYLQNYELMHKKDADIVPHLRKDYRLYIGQGIPDPWTKYPYIHDPEFFSLKDLRGMTAKHRKSFKNKLKDQACFCCQKKYLFECPDNCKTNSCCCSCKDCHSKNTSVAGAYGEKCRCFDVLENCVLKKAHFKTKKLKKRRTKRSSESSLSSSSYLNSSTEDDCQNIRTKHKLTSHCECYGNLKTLNTDSASDKVSFMDKKPFNFNVKSNTHVKEHSKVCFCPFVEKKLKSKDKKVSSEPKQSVSKLIQAELLPVKISKTVQTENRIKKKEPKCEWSNKCFQCSVLQCQALGNKASCLSKHSFPNFYLTPSLSYCAGFVCPISALSHHMICKPSKYDIKKQKEPCESEDQLQYRRSDTDKNYSLPKHNKKLEVRENELEKTHDDFKNNKNIYFCLTSPKTLDHLKYPLDDKLKSYSEKKSFTRLQNNKVNQQSPYLSSNLARLYEEGKSFHSQMPQRFKTYSYFEPNHECCFDKTKVITNKINLCSSNIRRFNYSNQATMTLAEEVKSPKNDVSTEVQYSEEKIKSSKLSTSLTRKPEKFAKKSIRKRKKLFENRKKRKKLSSSAKVSFGEHHAFLNKITNKPELVNKDVQVESSEDYQTLKRVPLHSDFINLNKNNSLLLGNSSYVSALTKDRAWRKTEQEFSSKNFNKFIRNTPSEEFLKGPLQSEIQFGGILEKISYNSGSTWSSNTLKNIVNDLLAENNSSKQNQNPKKTYSYT